MTQALPRPFGRRWPRTRHFFSDGDRLLQAAQKNLDLGLATAKRWWANKYKLPPNHELFQSLSLSELLIEMYEDLMMTKRELLQDLEKARGEERADLVERIGHIDRILNGGEQKFSTDPLIDKWEKEWADGQMPDLDEGP